MIHISGLRKRYGRVRALDGLNLDVPAGAIYGFIGQNGAGKTTTLRILATLLLPDDGVAQVAGVDVLRQPDEVRRLIGYMPDFFGVYEDLKVGEYLDFYGSLYGIRPPAIASLRENLLDLVDLGAKRDDYVDGLSRGMQQRLCLARSLIHDPSVLLLDEPASGLDPVARVEMRELLKELAGLGKTILISSHILSELADLCTHVGMVSGGRLVRQGLVSDLLLTSGRPGYILRVLREAERAASVLAELPGVNIIAVTADEIRFLTDRGAEDASSALAVVVGAGIPVIRFVEVEINLETTFVQIARAEVRL